MFVVLEDGSKETGGRQASSSRKTLYVVAAVVLAGGALALGTLTDPDPETVAAESTSTTRTTRPQPPSIDLDTFSPDQIEVGVRLEWEMATEITDLYPITVVEHGGWIYLFGSPNPYWDNGESAGLHAWRSEDGASWEALGTVIAEDVQIAHVAATDHGLIAMSRSGSPDSLFSVWRSSNGIEWGETPGPPAGSGPFSIVPTAVAATDRLLVVSGQESYDPTVLLSNRIEETLGLDIELSRYGWGTTSTAEGQAITISGPLGLPVLTVPLADLNLTSDEQDMILGAFNPSHGESSVWIRWDEDEWQQGTIHGSSWVGSLAPLPQGGFIALGWGTTGDSGWTSYDGLEWTSLPFGETPSSFEAWGDLMVGASNQEAGLLTSRDGTEWTETPLYLHFPRPISWGLTSYGAGDAGVVAVVEGWSHVGSTLEVPEPPTLTSGDVELTLNLESGNVSVGYGEESFSFPMWGPSLPEMVSADLATETIVITDPSTGIELGTFTFEEIYAAEDAYWGLRYNDHQPPFLAFSVDTEVWSINSIERTLGPDRRIIDLAVSDERVIAVVVDASDRFRPGFAGGFTVWSAALP